MISGQFFRQKFLFIFIATIICFTSKNLIFSRYKIYQTFSEEKASNTIENIMKVDFTALSTLNEDLFPILKNLQHQKFYRTMRVLNEQTCLYFKSEDHAVCRNKCCSVCKCENEDIPIEWRKEDKNECYIQDKGSEDTKSLQQKYEWYWAIASENEFEEGEYIDLVQNIEGYTANKEPNIWKIIYMENCFQGSQLSSEKIMLNQIISGFHASVSSHICEFFQDFSKEEPIMNPNWQMYFEKVGNYPERIMGLAFYYEFLLRAVSKSSEVFENYHYNTGDTKSDNQVKKLIREVSSLINSKQSLISFESSLFKGQDSVEIKKNYQKYIKNIAQIMDCVSCERCKLFAKMQVQGISLALNILFADNSDTRIKLMKRNELIILINTLLKSSESIQIINNMYQRRYNYYSNIHFLVSITIISIITLSISYLYLRENRKQIEKKVN